MLLYEVPRRLNPDSVLTFVPDATVATSRVPEYDRLAARRREDVHLHNALREPGHVPDDGRGVI